MEYINILNQYFKESEQQWLDIKDYPEYTRYKNIVIDKERAIQKDKEFIEELENSSKSEHKEIIENYLDDNEYIDKPLADYLEENYDLEIIEIMYNSVYELSDRNLEVIEEEHNSIYKIYDYYYLLKNDNDHYYEKWCRVRDIEETIDYMEDQDILNLLGKEEDEIYIDGWECNIDDLQKNPPVLYHYTTEEAWEEIQESGELVGGSGTGLGNRSANGIFTSFDSEEYAIGTYGDICLEINLPAYKKDNGLEEVSLYPEPEILEVSIRNLLKSYFDNVSLDEVPNSSGVSSLTVIINDTIPLKYIRVFEG